MSMRLLMLTESLPLSSFMILLQVQPGEDPTLLAQAVVGLYPGAKYSIGPAIENGFYYDFDLPDGARFTDAGASPRPRNSPT